jgi:eukaryotic-like serine/threonine-protein kinase
VIGETIGNFKIVSKLGRGGMGEVFLAEQQSIETKVAIKILHPEISADKEHITRFFNEARAVSRIHHAGIVKIFDVGFHTTGHAYLIMEYLEGESLAKRIERQKRLSLPQIADIGRQIASVLEATHSAGITHRDLKPDNIFIVPDRELASRERVKILDFGIAKLTGTLASVSPATIGTMGTPAYMAPEQWGDSAKVDWRADVYSLGCVAFEMSCGRPPFIVTNIAEACAKHLNDPPPPARTLMPDVPPRLEELLNRLLDKKPDRRPQSMAEVSQEFEAIGGTGASSAVGPTVGSIPALDPGILGTNRSQAGVTMPTQSPPPKNTTLGAAASQSMPAAERKRGKGLFFVLAACVAAVIGVLVFMAMRGDGSKKEVAANEPPKPQVKPSDPPKGSATNAGSDTPAGSAAQAGSATPSGSAASAGSATPSGSAAGSGDTHTGSAANAGSGTHVGSAAHAGSASHPGDTHAGSAAHPGDTHAGSAAHPGDTHAGSGAPHVDPTGKHELPDAPTHGSMMAAMHAANAKLMACHQQAPGVKAVRIHMEIDADGSVRSANATTARGAHNPATDCVAEVARRVKFPKSKFGSTFKFPFSFVTPGSEPAE